MGFEQASDYRKLDKTAPGVFSGTGTQANNEAAHENAKGFTINAKTAI
jgi:hypothetical protein